VIHQILFVELLGGIGDLILALPAIEAVARSWPGAALDVMTFAPGGELLIGDPRVRTVFFAHRAPAPRNAEVLRADLAALLNTRRYDLVVSDTRHSGIPEIIEQSGVSRVVTRLWDAARPDERIAHLFLRRLREEGIVDVTLPDPPARLFPTADERCIARELWNRLHLVPGRTVVFNPHAGVAVKRWPEGNFAALGRALAHRGHSIAVLAGEDPPLAWRIARAIPEARFVPRLSLRVTAAWLADASLVVSADSGLAHLAGAVGVPVLAIYGPTWAGRYGVAPPSANLQTPFPCPERNPMDFTVQRCWWNGRCIFTDKLTCCEDVTPAEALAAAERLLERDDGWPGMA